MALTMELFSTHRRGANGSNCVSVCACVPVGAHVQLCSLLPLVVKSDWEGMMESLKHAVTERRGGRRRGLKEEYWVLLAKVKNHAMVQRGLVLSTGRGDYINAGTQVLLNTPLLCPPLLPFVRPLPSLFPGCSKVQSRYKWLFAVQPPQHVSVCLCLSLTSC